MSKSIEKARGIFEDHGGVLRTRQALVEGISPRDLYAMRNNGIIIQISRGLYQLRTNEPPREPDLVTVASRIPKAVICLTSALFYHHLTSVIPRQVSIDLPRDAEKPRLDYPPLWIFWLSTNAYSTGIETITISEIPVKIYGLEKTIADCLKFRNKIGQDIAMEALKDYMRQPERKIDALMHYARINRVEKLAKQYLEALI